MGNIQRGGVISTIILLVVVYFGNGCGNSGKLSGGIGSNGILEITEGGVTAKVISATQIDLKWNPSQESDTAGYKVFRNSAVVAMITHPNTVYANSGLNPNTEYVFQVSSFDKAGNESVKTSPLKIKTLP